MRLSSVEQFCKSPTSARYALFLLGLLLLLVLLGLGLLLLLVCPANNAPLLLLLLPLLLPLLQRVHIMTSARESLRHTTPPIIRYIST